MWKQWITAILGLWVIAVPFTGLAGATLMWTLVVTGVVLAVLSFWSAAEQGSEESSSMRHAHS